MSLRCDVAYVVQAEDGSVVKVGVSGSPGTRVAQIKHSMPFPLRLVALVAGGRASEREMKQILAPWRMRGEWYEPRPELNDFLVAKRRENKLLIAVAVDKEYCDSFIKPAVAEYLSGRQPTMTDSGDLVYRFLREGAGVLSGRMDKLHTAVKKQISPEVLCGFLPLPPDEKTPALVLSDFTAAPTPAEEQAA